MAFTAMRSMPAICSRKPTVAVNKPKSKRFTGPAPRSQERIAVKVYDQKLRKGDTK